LFLEIGEEMEKIHQKSLLTVALWQIKEKRILCKTRWKYLMAKKMEIKPLVLMIKEMVAE
jgi:hypothetical protein